MWPRVSLHTPTFSNAQPGRWSGRTDAELPLDPLLVPLPVVALDLLVVLQHLYELGTREVELCAVDVRTGSLDARAKQGLDPARGKG